MIAQLRTALQERPGTGAGRLGDFDGPLYGVIDPVSERVTALCDLQLRVAGEEFAAAEQRTTQAERVALGLLGGGALLGIVLATLTARGTAKLLSQIKDAIAQLVLASGETAAAAEQVSQSSQSLAAGASEQAAALETTSAALEEISARTHANAQSAKSSTEKVDSAKSVASRSTERMQAMQAAMEAIRASSDQIERIVKTIDDLAFQTNILALNASVEAARAGEAGAGFAVVAEEVRALAQRSANAAKDSEAQIGASRERGEAGLRLTQELADDLVQLRAHVEAVETLVATVAEASNEQSSAVDQVNSSVNQLDQVTQSNAASAEETASAAEELHAQAELTRQVITRLGALVGVTVQAGQGDVGESAATTAAPSSQPADRT